MIVWPTAMPIVWPMAIGRGRVGKGSAEQVRAAGRIPGTADEDDHRDRCKKYAEVSGTLMASPLFRATVRISLIAKGPIFAFFCWAETQRGSMLVRRREAFALYVKRASNVCMCCMDALLCVCKPCMLELCDSLQLCVNLCVCVCLCVGSLMKAAAVRLSPSTLRDVSTQQS
jgi:hypothetical protein